ncbi:FG-GAP repeat protein [Pontimonas sp.]|nr:FG-GAP repeat protein [Pontimonas sp.]
MRKARMTAIPLATIALVASLPLSASAEGVWSQKGADIPGAAIGDGFGIALDIDGDGDTVAIGADSNNDGGSDAGHVQVLGYSAGAWSRIGAILVGDDADDFFGSAVSLSDDGTRVAIGAPFDDDGGGSSGHVQVWENVGGTWSQMGATLVGEDAGERAGSSVAISGDGTTVVIGSPSIPMERSSPRAPETTMGPVQALGTRVSTPGTPEPANGTSADQILMAKRPVIVLAQRYR